MTKRNVFLKTAVASAMLAVMASASAGIGSANRSFAVELFNGSTPAAVAPVLAPISYQFSGPVAAASTFYIYISLSNGAFFTAAPAVTTLLGATSDGAAVDSVGGLGGTVSVVGLGTDGTTPNNVAVFRVVLLAGKALSSASVFTFTPTVGITANSALSTLGGTVTATWTNASTSTTTALPAGDIDTSGTHSGVVATAVQGIAFTAASSAAFPFNTAGVAEKAQINLGATPISTTLTTPGATLSNANSASKINLGAIRAKNGTAVAADGATAYTIAANATGSLSYTLTAPAGFFAALGTTKTVWLDSGADCNTVTLAGSASTVYGTNALAAAATTITKTGITSPTTNVNYYVCMEGTGAIPFAAGTPSLTATLVHNSTATDSNNVVSSTLYPLTTNGAVKYVRNYLPAALGAGYVQTVRVINSGSLAADVFVTVVDDVTGLAGTSAKVLTALAPGASARLTQAAIEAAVGAVAVGSRPRLRITAQTDSLEVQSIFNNANGAYTNLSGVE